MSLLIEKDEKDADQRLVDSQGATAIELAAAVGHRDIVSLLLKGTTDAMRGAASDAATKAGHTEIVTLIANWWKQQIFAQLDPAIPEAEQVNRVGKLRDHPGDNLGAVTNSDGNTPLAVVLAASTPNPYLVELLVNAAPETVIAANKDGECPLIQWCKGDIPLMNLLLAANTDLKLVQIGPDLLNAAAAGGKVEMVDRLVGMGLDINAADAKKQKPLYVAAGKGNDDMIAELAQTAPSLI